MPVYVVGTEVPPPGGADHALDAIQPTRRRTRGRPSTCTARPSQRKGLAEAFARVIGLVVQPGVEFGNRNVIPYDRSKARSLAGVLDEEPHLVFEAHSTDYQGAGPLREPGRDGFAILKVGPELTFVLREALYALDLIASDLLPGYGDRPLMQAMEALMLASPALVPPLRPNGDGSRPAPLLTLGSHPLLLDEFCGTGGGQASRGESAAAQRSRDPVLATSSRGRAVRRHPA